MPQDSRRSGITPPRRREVPINQRLGDALALLAINVGFALVGNLLGQTEQPACDNYRGRTISISVMNALIVEVEPGHAVIRQFADHVIRDLCRRGKQPDIVSSSVAFAESVKRPARAARPCRTGSEPLMRVGEDYISRLAVVRQIESDIPQCPAAQFQTLAAITRVVMHGLNDRAIGPYEQFGRSLGVIQSHLPPFCIAGLLACPPENL